MSELCEIKKCKPTTEAHITPPRLREIPEAMSRSNNWVFLNYDHLTPTQWVQAILKRVALLKRLKSIALIDKKPG